MTVPHEGFGARLRRERERRGITLDAIAESTKIKRSLLEGLERNDLSRWPDGIFRRAFVRAYAAAIGLPVEPLVAEFLQLFPEPRGDDKSTSDTEPSSLRLLLASDHQWFTAGRLKVMTAAADAVAVVVIAVVLATLTGRPILPAVGVVALSYYTIATACLGRTPAAWCLNRLTASPVLAVRRTWSVRRRRVATFYRDAVTTRQRTEVPTAGRLLGS